jgi:periplasmic protein TonB
MRAAAMASFAVHVAVMVLLFAIGAGASHIVPGPEVVQVSLIAPPSDVVAPQTPPPPREPTPRGETLKPTDATGVKLAPLKARRDEKEKPLPKKTEPEPLPTTTVLPAARTGPQGLTGEVAVDSGNFEFTYYLVLIRNRITDNWSPPTGLATHGQPVRATVYFRVDREGQVTAPRLEAVSGAEFFDRSALRAVQLSTPMPPLPDGYTGADLGVHFEFEYQTP